MIFYKYEGHEIRQLHVPLRSKSHQRNHNDIQSLFLKYISVILKFNSHVFYLLLSAKMGLMEEKSHFHFFTFACRTL